MRRKFPQWAELPLEALLAGGTDNAIYGLGDELSVRLPRRPEWAPGSLDKDFEWLPKLAPLPPSRFASGDIPKHWLRLRACHYGQTVRCR